MNTDITSFDEYKKIYDYSVSEPEKFWAEVAGNFRWKKKWSKVLDWNFTEPKVEWFTGGECNLSENCLDRHLYSIGDKTAIIWEPNDPSERSISITYKELHQRVSQFASALLSLGIKKGDKVCIYLPMIIPGAVAMLACARIGAVHSVVFAGFSAQSLADRMNDAQCKLLITADAVFRGDKKIELKKIADEALKKTESIEHCIVYNHRNTEIAFEAGRDIWWDDIIKNASTDLSPASMYSEDPLFILYTSGSTGKPKGILHTTGGYMVYAGYTFKQVFNYTENDVFCCTADIGWVTGHTYLIYGPLLNGATTVMFEGVPTYPDHGRFWDLVDKHQVSIFYTAPTAIRSLLSYGHDVFDHKDLSSLRVLGSVGEPINEEAWHWYYKYVGKEKCPIVDTWWQTETGGVLISPLANVTPLRPAYATLPLPGIQPVLVDEKGNEVTENEATGNLCIKFPWPGMSRSIYGDHERFRQTYFSTYPNYYFTGDGCKRDADGYHRITGRVDDVINVSGHRIGTGELEDAIDEHEAVIESAVVAYPHDIKGQGIYAFVICEKHIEDKKSLISEIREQVSRIVGSFAKPDKIQVVDGLPKTRSGKIMRRILRKIAEGDTSNLGDTSTLIDPGVVESIKANAL